MGKAGPEVVGRLAPDEQFPAGHWVAQAQLGRVQHQSGCGRPGVAGIAEDRHPAGAQVDADLVFAARQRLSLDEQGVGFPAQDP